MFSLASLVQVQQHAAKLTAHQSFWAKLSDKMRHPLAHKRGQEELYESTMTPFNSPEKTTRTAAGAGATVAGPEAERKTVAESPAIEERSPSPPRTEVGMIEAVVPGGVVSEAPSSTTAAAPTQAASSIQERKEPSGPKIQPVVASLSTVDNQRKCVLAKVSAQTAQGCLSSVPLSSSRAHSTLLVFLCSVSVHPPL